MDSNTALALRAARLIRWQVHPLMKIEGLTSVIKAATPLWCPIITAALSLQKLRQWFHDMLCLDNSSDTR